MFRRLFSFLAAIALAIGALFAATTAEAGVQIRVNLSNQTLTAVTPDGETRNWVISSGRTGFRTIRGSYRPYMLKTYHWSRKYRGHMPHSIFFKGGYAIHGTTYVSRLGTPASSGCIRLHPAAAKELFGMVQRYGQRSTRISINGVAPDTGRTMVARAKIKQQPQVARAPRPTSVGLTAPAYAPSPFEVPASRAFQRLR